MNVGEIKRRVRVLFGDLSGAQIADEDLLRFINDGQVDVVRQTHVLSKKAETDVISSDGTYTLPSDFLVARRVTYNKTPLMRSSIEEIDRIYRDHETSTGTSQYYYIVGRILHLVPTPSVDGSNNLDLWYAKTPLSLVSDVDVPEVPETFHEDIVMYALALCKQTDDDYDVSSSIKAEYGVRVSESRSESNESQDSFGAIRLLPGD